MRGFEVLAATSTAYTPDWAAISLQDCDIVTCKSECAAHHCFGYCAANGCNCDCQL
jgi:hypothetical protein